MIVNSWKDNRHPSSAYCNNCRTFAADLERQTGSGSLGDVPSAHVFLHYGYTTHKKDKAMMISGTKNGSNIQTVRKSDGGMQEAPRCGVQ